jgi:hypothetical protein
MSRKSLSLVNQKLTHARLLLAQLKHAEGVLANALAESVVGQLACAYRHYLRELAEAYQVRVPGGIVSEADLTSALLALNKQPTEAQELVDLRARPDSWVSELQLAYEQLWRTPAQSVPPRESAGLIPLVPMDTEPLALSVERLSLWYESFIDMIQRHRETSAEW